MDRSAAPVLLLLLCTLGTALASVYPRFGQRPAASDSSARYAAQWLQQPLDHLSATDKTTFAQRYYVVSDYWAAPNGPFILYIAGEGPQDGPGGVDDEITVLAKQNKAAILTLEHRFFGQSLPFTELTTANLRYLNVEQELEDLAYFAKYYQALINKQYSKTSRNLLLAVGGSYAGMIASHLRYRHPDIIDGAWSSSGVVNAVYNFTDFDLQVAVALGQKCAQIVRRASDEIEVMLAGGTESNQRVKALFNATGMSDDDLMWMLSDAETLPPQYGMRSRLCDPLEAAFDAGKDIVQAYADVCNGFFYPAFCSGAGPYLYGDALMLETSATTPYAAQRAWWWFVCNELAYAQTYPGPLGIRSPRITLEWHGRKCDTVFGKGVWPPNTVAFNNLYGGAHPKATNVFYINSSQDPWRWAGVLKTLSASQPAYIMTGTEVGHCRDLHKPASTDPIDVVAARTKAETFFKTILSPGQ
jgi:hypothetical protein